MFFAKFFLFGPAGLALWAENGGRRGGQRCMQTAWVVAMYVLAHLDLARISWPPPKSCGRLDSGPELFVIFCILRS